MQLLNIENWPQQREGYCLPACAAMILRHLGRQVNYSRIIEGLGTTRNGTFFPQIEKFNSLRVKVDLATGDLDSLRDLLADGTPIIVPVATELLPYWMMRPDRPDEDRITEHAVVVVGIDEQYIYVNDPDFDEAPQSIEIGWFDDAWEHRNRSYAVIRSRW